MAEPRKIFRIEKTAVSRSREAVADAQAPLRYAELMNEIAALRAAVTATAMRQSGTGKSPADRTSPPPADTGNQRLASELSLIIGAIDGGATRTAGGALPAEAPPMTRIAHELAEIASSTEKATQRVLAAAEEIDQVAKSLSAALNGQFENGLLQDIQDHVVRIFEACNFQDLAGQRVNKVLSILNFVEDHVARVLEDIARDSASAQQNGSQHLHGPRLESDSGHVTQAEIDLLFGT